MIASGIDEANKMQVVVNDSSKYLCSSMFD